MANGDGDPFTDVDTLAIVPDDVAVKIKQAAGITLSPDSPPPVPAPIAVEMVTKPGVERWPVKTGVDPDHGRVGKNVIAGQDLGAGIVLTTVEELITAPRPDDMQSPTGNFPEYNAKRAAPVETTVWRLDARITALKQEADGDYHLVLQGASGETMIGEIPTPTTVFIGDSPWMANIQAARAAVDAKLVHPIAQDDFITLSGKMVPPASSITALPTSKLTLPRLPGADAEPAPLADFKIQVPVTSVRITGVGFFDRVHGQMGVSQLNGIELHPVLKIEWL